MQNPDEIVALVRSWVVNDRMRIVAGMLAFILCLRAISVPFPSEPEP